MGDYFLEPQFATDFDRAEAEELMVKVSGPSVAEINERARSFSMLQFPRHQVLCL